MTIERTLEGQDTSPWYRTERGLSNKIVYKGSPAPTLGLELELQIIDPETRDLISGGPAILERHQQDEWAKAELLQSTLEINVGPCHEIGEARSALSERMGAVLATAKQLGYGLASAGTHPFSGWESQQLTEDRRYSRMLERMQWPVRRLMIFGLHVHVGVSSGEKAIAICNSLTTFLPHLLALSASSPFWAGEDTGLASVRVKIFESLPTAGLPYRMINWGEFQRFMNTLINAGAIQSIREVWWDVRPHPVFGTVEVRIADALPTLRENLAIAALTQCLVVRLSELYDSGDCLPIHRHWVVAENKWRAARFADEAMIISDDSGSVERLRELILSLVEGLEPVSKQLNCRDELLQVGTMLEQGVGFRRQRRIYRDSGDLKAVVDALMDELRLEAV